MAAALAAAGIRGADVSTHADSVPAVADRAHDAHPDDGLWSRQRRLRRALALPLALLAAWWAAFAFGPDAASLYVPPGQVLETGWRLAGTPTLWSALGHSLLRAAAGFGLGAAAGVLAGVLLGVSPLARRLFGPSLHALRQVSLFAWVPLIMVWFGLGESSKVVFVSIAVFFPVLLNTAEGVAGIAREHLEVAKVATFSRGQTFLRLILPSATPSILNGVHIALVGAWGATLGAENLMTSGPGIGKLLIDGQETSAMDVTLVAMLLAGTVGYGLHLAAKRAEARLLRWRPHASAETD